MGQVSLQHVNPIETMLQCYTLQPFYKLKKQIDKMGLFYNIFMGLKKPFTRLTVIQEKEISYH